jgi:ABC-type amino acid transport substrate-binding protein
MHVRLVGIGAAIVVAVTLALAILLSRITTPPDRSLDRVQQSGDLVIGVDPSYPPFEVVNGAGQLAGFDIEMLTELATRLGVKARFVSIDFGGIYDALGVAKFDLIVGGVSPSSDNDLQLGYTRSYYDDGLVLVAGSAALGTVLGIESGADADLDLPQLRDKLSGYTFRHFDDQDQIRLALEGQLLRGAIVDRVTASQWVEATPSLTISSAGLTSVPYVIVGRRGDQKLIEAVDRTLKTMLDDGFIAALDRKWIQP